MPICGAVRSLNLDEVDEAAHLMAAAFLYSPVYIYIFEGLDAEKRQEALFWLFNRNIYLRLSSSRCAFDEISGKMVCCYMLHGSDDKNISIWSMLTNGILTLPFLYGLKAFTRLLEVKAYHERLDDGLRKTRIINTKKYITLERMVVSPTVQGHGIGSKCLHDGLIEAQRSGVDVYLTTQEIRNISFYSRLGFVVIRKDEDYPFRLQSIECDKEDNVQKGELHTIMNTVMVKSYATSSQDTLEGI